MIDENYDIATEICKQVTGRYYKELDGRADKQIIHDLFMLAGTIRYLRMGINPAWVAKEILEKAQEIVRADG